MRIRPVTWGLAAVVVALISLETILQAAAFAASVLYRRESAPATGGAPVVLCLGDSFTYGLGASSPGKSYPGQLEEALHARGLTRWRVVNGGWPGRNSRDLLENAAGQLASLSPEAVYVMVGVNDEWSHPARLTLASRPVAAAGSFQWRWRTGRLAAILSQHVAAAFGTVTPGPAANDNAPPRPANESRPSDTPAHPPAGNWIVYGSMVIIGSDGAVTWPGRSTRWSSNGAELVLIDTGNRERPFRWRTEGSELHLEGPGDTGTIVLHAPSPLERAAFDAVRAADESGSVADARAGIEVTPGAGAAELRSAREILLRSASDRGDRASSLELSRRLIDDGARESWIWTIFAWQTFLAGDRAQAERAIQTAIAAPGDAQNRAEAQWTAALILRDADPGRALVSAVSSYLLDGNEDRFIQILQQGVDGIFSPARFRSALEALNLPPSRYVPLEAIYRKSQLALEAYVPTLRYHLTEVVARAAAAGAQPVLVSYPFPSPRVEEAMKQVAAETGAGWLNVRAEFDRRLATEARETLFVPDGHLNDRGYQLLAALVADDVAKRAGSAAP